MKVLLPLGALAIGFTAASSSRSSPSASTKSAPTRVCLRSVSGHDSL